MIALLLALALAEPDGDEVSAASACHERAEATDALRGRLHHAVLDAEDVRACRAAIADWAGPLDAARDEWTDACLPGGPMDRASARRLSCVREAAEAVCRRLELWPDWPTDGAAAGRNRGEALREHRPTRRDVWAEATASCCRLGGHDECRPPAHRVAPTPIGAETSIPPR